MNLMNTRKTRLREADTRYEKHHIIPKSMGGTDTDDNLVDLTFKEHYLAHLLLTKITRGKDKAKMVHAWNMMTSFEKKYGKKHVTSRLYSMLKEEYAVYQGEIMIGFKHSKKAKRKMSVAMKGNTNGRANIGRKNTEAQKKTTGYRTKSTCPHCMKTGQAAAMGRWHFDNCKEKAA